MESFCWTTNWVTVGGFGNSDTGSTVTPPDTSYLDLGDYDDLVVYLDVKEVTGVVTCSFQTAASKDDASFVTMFAPIALAPTTSGPLVTRVFGNYAAVPIARWMRWQLFGGKTGAWNTTFRLFLAAHSFGR